MWKSNDAAVCISCLCVFKVPLNFLEYHLNSWVQRIQPYSLSWRGILLPLLWINWSLIGKIFKNYRSVSNFYFISKLTERTVCVQLVNHLKENDLYEIFQSAYRQLHSTETALLRVQNDIIHAVDSEVGAILTLLDLSAAFDTIDHQKLLDLLNHSFGISWDTLRWFKSYLQERIQMVQIGSSISKPVTLKYGVPQGSVLEPILFTMYTHSTW